MIINFDHFSLSPYTAVGDEDNAKLMGGLNGEAPMIPTLQTLPPDDDMSDHTPHNGLNEGEEIYINEDEEDEEEEEEEDGSDGCYDNRLR